MKRWLSNLLIVIFVLIFLVSAGLLINYWYQSRQSQGQFDELAQMMEQAKPPVATVPQPEAPTTGNQPATEPVSELVTVHHPVTDEPVEVLPELAELFLMNPDLEGWITVNGTNINYPVMHTPDRQDYYLYRDFYGKDSAHGCIYIREQCNPYLSDNVVIYGHRMKDGSMFNNLLYYEDKDYYEAHKYIQFNTLTQRHTYEIIAVFKTVATSSGYPYYLFVDAADEAAFDTYVADCKAMSLYDTGLDAVYGDKLITLSTCEYSRDNGRMVVVARQID